MQTSDVIAGLALIVSVIALVHPWWQRRSAVIEFGHECLQPEQGQSDLPTYRFVVKNHGPATARHVDFEFFYDQTKLQLLQFDGPIRIPIPVLHPGHEYRFGYNPNTKGNRIATNVEVIWRDKRIGRRRLRVWLSGPIGGPATW